MWKLSQKTFDRSCLAVAVTVNTSFLRRGRRRTFSTQDNNHPLEKSLKALPPSLLQNLDSRLYNTTTFQRNNVEFDSVNGKILRGYPATKDPSLSIVDVRLDPTVVSVSFSDGTDSVVTYQQIQQEISAWNGGSQRVTWTGFTEDTVRRSDELSLTFDNIVTQDGAELALRTLFQYGIVLVTNTPIHDGGYSVAALGAALSGGDRKNASSLLTHYNSNKTPKLVLDHGTDGPLRTLYGTVWSTSSSGQADGSSIADSAYGHESLPLHTDMTYLRDPPGLQIFTMVRPANHGGESVFGDGFAAADILRKENPEAFYVLCQTRRRYRSIDHDTGWHLEARGPVLDMSTSPSGQVVSRIRHNDLDRLPDFPLSHLSSSKDEQHDFYTRLEAAHSAWDDILNRDSVRLVMNLQPGDTMVVANQRCLHGRFGFRVDGHESRSVMGCYVSQDDLDSRFRRLGFVV